MRDAATSMLVAAIVAVVAFGGGLVAGYVYSHDPQPERVEVRVDTSAPPDGEQVLPGTVTRVDGTSVEVTTVLGATSVEVDALILEELEPLAGAVPESGTPVNLGGTRSDTGYVLSGIVVVESER